MQLLTGLAVLIGIIRLVGVTSPAFQAVAHLYVFGLVVAALMVRPPKRWGYVALFVGLTVLETLCFLFLPK